MNKTTTLTKQAPIEGLIYNRVVFNCQRLPGDCGIIAFAAMVSKYAEDRGAADKRADYTKAAKFLTEAGVYNGDSSNFTSFINKMKWVFGLNTRVVYSQAHQTVAQFIARRKNWTGFVTSCHEGTYHVMPVVNGVIYNAGSDYINSRCLAALACK